MSKEKFLQSFTLRDFPIFGSLTVCRPVDHLNASGEFLWTLFLAALPIIGSLVIFSVVDFGPDKTVLWRLGKFADGGDLLILGAAMTAPILYLVQKEFGGSEERVTRFYHRNAFSLSFVILLLISAFLYAVLEFQKFSPSGFELRGSIYFFSYLVLACGIILSYLCYVYRNAIENAGARDLIRGESDLLGKWDSFKEDNPDLLAGSQGAGNLSGVAPPEDGFNGGGAEGGGDAA